MNTTARGVLLRSLDDDFFCDGIDFKALRGMWHNRDYLHIQNYFFNLTRFAHFMANYKKPMMIDINGELNNAALAIFLNRPMLINRTFSKGCKCLFFAN